MSKEKLQLKVRKRIDSKIERGKDMAEDILKLQGSKLLLDLSDDIREEAKNADLPFDLDDKIADWLCDKLDKRAEALADSIKD